VDWTPREVYELREQRDRLAEVLRAIQARVTGECFPNWDNHPNTFRSRDFIADICEEALAAVEGGSDE
jgi:hypothetical protein